MSRFLLGALAMGAFVVLTSFAVRAAADPVVKKNGPAWTVSQYQLDRAFRVPIQLGSGSPLTSQVPMSGGFIITELRVLNPSGNLTITINGVGEDFAFGNQIKYEFDPPIIARPGDTVTLLSPNSTPPLITFCGYTTLPGET